MTVDCVALGMRFYKVGPPHSNVHRF